MRPSSNAPSPVESREAPPTSSFPGSESKSQQAIIMELSCEESCCSAGNNHGQRGLVGYSPWGREELDTTERLHFPFSLSCIGEEMAAHSSVLAWRIPGTGEPGGLLSTGSRRVPQPRVVVGGETVVLAKWVR